jgi:hypothetical protein
MYIAFACPYVIDQKLGLPGHSISVISINKGSKAVILYIYIMDIKHQISFAEIVRRKRKFIVKTAYKTL